METQNARSWRRKWVMVNYIALVMMNFCFYLVFHYRDMPHVVDVVGLGALLIVVITFIRVHRKTGLWVLTHSRADALDERQVQLTHNALSQSYAWFTIVCLTIMLIHAIMYRLVPGLDFVITIPLVGSLIYLAHTLPGSVLAWTEMEVPGEVQ